MQLNCYKSETKPQIIAGFIAIMGFAGIEQGICLSDYMKKYRDYYFLKAKNENYPARSIYKLQEIDNRYKIFHPGMRILDLGASPGSWSLYASQKIGTAGKIIACDLKPIEPLHNPIISFYQEDILAPSKIFLQTLQSAAPFNIVMSDMAPATTGNKFTDQIRSANLVEAALLISLQNLKTGGLFIAKIFMGAEMENIQKEILANFVSVKIFKPKSSRSESKEIYILGFKKKLVKKDNSYNPE